MSQSKAFNPGILHFQRACRSLLYKYVEYEYMPPLSDDEIARAIEGGALGIEPFTADNVQPASIDLTLGAEAFIASHDDKTLLNEGDVLVLPPGEMALVLTRERLSLGIDYAATIGLRSHFARKGIDLLAGPQVDPGFQGPLHIVLINLSPSQQVIAHGEPFLTLEIHRLSEPASRRYTGEYQAQTSITASEIRDLKKGEGIALSEVVKAMRNIAKDVDSLDKSVARLEQSVSQLTRNVDWYMRIFTVTIVILVAGVLGALWV